MSESDLKPEDVAIRAHDIAVCLQSDSVAEFDLLTTLGMAVRLALHLRGVPAVSYSVIRQVAVYFLDFQSAGVRPVLHLLAEAEFVRLDVEGKTIKTVIPTVPYYEKVFTDLGDFAGIGHLSEPEFLAVQLLHRLAQSPMLRDHAYQLGAERSLVDRVLDIGNQGAFMIEQRARGRSVLVSPTYFSESQDAYADLVAGHGAGRVKKVLDLLRANQGWPLAKLQKDGELGGVALDRGDLAVAGALAGEGFVPPPAIETSHHGMNFFLFGPRPGPTRLAPTRRPVYEAAMALVAAVRQGQLLPERYSIRSPKALLRSFKEKGYLRANTEALEQYRGVAAARVARLEDLGSGWGKLVLIDERPENLEALDMAIELVAGAEPPIEPGQDIVLALRKGERYVESLVGRRKLIREGGAIEIDEESREAVDSYLLRGRE